MAKTAILCAYVDIFAIFYPKLIREREYTCKIHSLGVSMYILQLFLFFTNIIQKIRENQAKIALNRATQAAGRSKLKITDFDVILYIQK